jgi:phenylalanine-4-hydroxylase
MTHAILTLKTHAEAPAGVQEYEQTEHQVWYGLSTTRRSFTKLNASKMRAGSISPATFR